MNKNLDDGTNTYVKIIYSTFLFQIFDTVAGQSLLAAGGALAAKAGVAKSGTKTGISGGLLCKRSIVTRPELFDNSLPSIKGETLKLLPSSLTEIELNSNLLSQPEDLALAIYSIFVVFKLISVGHPASKPYYEEICGKMWPKQNLDECESKLVSKIFLYLKKSMSFYKGEREIKIYLKKEKN